MTILLKKVFLFSFFFSYLLSPFLAIAESEFNPHFIISDPEMQDYQSWGKEEIQQFLISKGSYLQNSKFPDASGTLKTASEIIYDAAQNYKVNPKFLLVTLQKEQSLITDDSPSTRQLDWATGYAVCDGCYISDPKVQKYKGFGKQVDGAAGIIRWYYENSDKSYIKKKDTPIRIDNTEVTPGSWATAFLYTYTPHLHGNKNFWRIWNTWFEQVYPNGTLLQSTNSSEYWLIENGTRRLFKNKSALITRTDPKLAIKVDETNLQNYKLGPEISFSNYSLLNTGSTVYLLDYDTLRPFASREVVGALGYNPDELIDVEEFELQGYSIGKVISASSTPPQGVIYKITDAKDTYYLLKDDTLYPVLDPAILQTSNFKNLPIEKHRLKDLSKYPTADLPIKFSDGTLIQEKNSNFTYVIENGKKRLISDEDTFIALGYKRSNVTLVNSLTAMNIPTGEKVYVNSNLLSSRTKYLGDNAAEIDDLYGESTLPSYLVAEYPTGRIITGKNIDSRRPIASLTKILTAYEALNQNFKMTGNTIYSAKKFDIEGSNSLKLKDGEKIKNVDMFYTMLVASSNSAAKMVAMSTGLTEDEIVRKINLRLEEWGADFSNIADVTGLDENNKSTARDLLKIFIKVLGKKSIKDALGTVNYNFKEISSKDKIISHSFKNTNQIIPNIPLSKRSYKILATKTGYTEEADSVLLMLIEVKKTKKQYVIVTLGNPNYAKRFEEPHKIAEWASTQKFNLATKK